MEFEVVPSRRTILPRGWRRLGARTLAALLLGTLALLPIGCSQDADPDGSARAGGNTAGGSGSGGLPASGGAGASRNTGGTVSGGSSSGGTSGAGPSTGGTRPTGGAPANTGGALATGGTQSTGGQSGGTASGGRSGGGGAGGDAAAGNGGAAGGGGGGMDAIGGSGGSGGAAPPVGKKFVGNIDTRGRIRPDFVNYWNQFSAENAGKWGSVERQRDQMNWSALDEMYAYAKQHGIIFKQHTMVWGSQQPMWLSGLSQEEQRAEVEEWIRLFCERYPDTKLIDVVNEPPPHTTPPYVAALGGSGTSGYDWIAQAFKWTHQYCPDAILLLNDYNNIEYTADNDRTIEIAKKIAAAGAPIHAIGAQGHDAFKLSTNTVKGFIDKIVSETGLPVYITEYDIDLGNDGQQRDVMESQFTMFWNHDRIHGITLWGYISGQTWKQNTGLMSSSGAPRPAMTWLLDFLEIQ